MAKKRMFSVDIVGSDAFLDLPHTAQALYFQLGMRADDDGFVGNPKTIQRIAGSKASDLELLVKKRFLLQFPSGVVVIKHWKINNDIKKDRYSPTVYTDEFQMLYTKENKAYTERDANVSTLDTERGQNVSTLDTQYSIDKNSKDKDSIVLCKHAHGFFSNVFLTDEEMQKLSSEIPNLDDYIERLSNYLANNKKEYKSHCATIRNWYRRDVDKTAPSTNHEDDEPVTPKKEEKLLMNREQSIRATFDIFKPDGVIEVRSMSGYTFSGYFRDREKLISELARHDDKTWYFVMNEINEGCYSREQNERILSKKGLKTTGDNEITAIKWILIDADPERATGVSSTDAEKAKALETIKRVYKYLRQEGFSDPVVCDSGNGYHLLYSVDMMVEDAEYTKKFLQAIDMLFSDADVKIDTAVFNPSRITKVYGTIARKGANTMERPHRASGFVYIPEEIRTNSIHLLKKVIKIIPEPPKPVYRNDRVETFDIDKFIADNGIQVSRETVSGGIRKIVLEECPFDPSHKAPDSAIFVMQNGAIAFKCFHNSCSDKRWRDVRQLFDPTCYERKQEQNRTYQLPPRHEKNTETAQDETPHFLRMQDIEIIDRSKIVSIKTGIDALDKKLIGMNKGELSIWSGGNGSGKSTFLSQLALETISRGFNVAMFSGELTSNRAKSWLQLQAAGRAHTKLSDNGVSYYVPKEKADAIDEWAADKLWIYNNQYGIKVNSVIDDFVRHIEQHPTDVVIIDNLMSLDLSEIRGEKYDRQTTLVLTLSEFAKKYNVHIHFVCHPRKPVGFLRKSDISGTADLTNAADNVFMMHRVNQDFLRLGGEFLGQAEIKKYEDYTNVIEIMKNRDLGVSDEFVGVYYEPESKRMLNFRQENKRFGWNGEDAEYPEWAEECDIL